MPDVLLTHGYFLHEDEKEQRIMKPYAPLGILYLSAYLKREGLSGLSVGYVGAGDPQLWPIPGLPSSFLLDGAGVVRRVQYGPLNEATLNSWLGLNLK